ncbi:MAG: hypothetical protein QUU85_01025, partial [Candidatus Eisenbacteria bacterium]|nr:hypothetical protein [Candidatus Eisenbacteria bacterium]
AVSAAAILDLPARLTSSRSDESRVAQRMQQAEALLVEGDRLRHSEDFTREHMVDALRAFDRAKQIVLDTTPQRYTPALLRFVDWRRGECWYFLGELESDPRGFESARECWRTANSYPFDSRILASLDPQSPTFRRLRDLWRGQAISGLGLVESKLGEFRNPARHLRVAVWSHRIAYEAALDSTALVPIAGRHAIQQERIRFARNDLAGSLLRLGATIDSICYIDEAIRICAETERTRMFPADPSAHASCLHNWGLALLERAERNGSAEDLAGAQERFVQAIQVREAGAARVRHTASHRELARALALQARRETDARARSRGFAQAESLLWRGLDSLPEDRRTSIAGFQRATAAALIDRVARDAADASQTLGQDAVHAASLDGRPASFVDRGLVLADSLLTEASARVDAGDAPARMAWIEFERGRLARVRSWVVQEQAVRGHGGDSAVTEATATKGDGFPQPAVNALGAASAFREEALRHFELADDLLPEPQHPALHRMILGEMRLLD